MTERGTLKTVLIISLVGVVFSGTLSYSELFGENAVSCPAFGAPGTILGYPACVYGFCFFLLITIIVAAGLWFSRTK